MKSNDITGPVPEENPLSDVQPVVQPESHPHLLLEKRIEELEQRVKALEKGIFADREDAYRQGTGRFLL